MAKKPGNIKLILWALCH